MLSCTSVNPHSSTNPAAAREPQASIGVCFLLLRLKIPNHAVYKEASTAYICQSRVRAEQEQDSTKRRRGATSLGGQAFCSDAKSVRHRRPLNDACHADGMLRHPAGIGRRTHNARLDAVATSR